MVYSGVFSNQFSGSGACPGKIGHEAEIHPEWDTITFTCSFTSSIGNSPMGGGRKLTNPGGNPPGLTEDIQNSAQTVS